jgi:hypothetical protein
MTDWMVDAVLKDGMVDVIDGMVHFNAAGWEWWM